jgi:hypothetical protein
VSCARRASVLLGCAIGAAALLTACDDSSKPSGNAATALLLPGGPQGYTLNASASGPLDLNSARVATIADPDTLGTALGRNQFDTGASAVWQQGDDYETDIVFRFHTPAQAQAVLDVEHRAMDALGSVATAPDTIPQAWAYTMFGSTRSGGKQVFCQGVWFAASADLYGITTCSPLPGGEDRMLARAALQLQRAQPSAQSPSATR